MKSIMILIITFTSQWAFANENCATGTSDIAKIEGLISQVNPWGTWKGTWDGKTVTITLSKSSGNFTGKANYDGSDYGPKNITICDYGDAYSVIVLGYEAPLEVLGSKKIRLTSPLDSNDKIELKKN